MRAVLRPVLVTALAVAALVGSALPAAATPVCTDGYMGGPPRTQCGGRIFPEPEMAQAYVQYAPNPAGFREYQHGIEFLAQTYPRWISVFSLRDYFASDDAVSAGPDGIRPYEEGDEGDGRDIWVIKITDHEVPDAGKETLLFSLSVHGNERGGLEGGLRTAEDLAIAAEEGGTIVDGIDNYESATGREPAFHEYEVADVLAREAVYLIDFNIDGWTTGDFWTVPSTPYARGNSLGTDLNRQMPTTGRINENRNPLQESEMRFGTEFMHDVAELGIDGRMAYGADVHGELTSNAYIDIMYPAGQFDSVDHRRLMAIAERTKSVVDATLYEGIIDEIEAATGGNEAEQPGDIPTKPAHWATVWDTLGYTDTGFIGDYMATDLGVTGMDYEIFLNHTVPDRNWNIYLQENHINGTRAIIKTAMAYALTQAEEFNADNVVVDPVGRAGYVLNPDTVSDADENGAGTLPGPEADGIGADGQPVTQRSYEATNMRWFEDTSPLMGERPFVALLPADIAADSAVLDQVDTLVLADVALPVDAEGRQVDAAAYYGNLRAWVERGGNLVLTDRAIHALGDLGVVPADAVTDQQVYMPYSDIQDFEHPLVAGLRPNARQLVEAAVLGYCIGNTCSPTTTVAEAAFTEAGGQVVGTTGDGLVSIGELPLGAGLVRVVGGALPMPTEEHDHRYGLRDYALTYSGLYVMENAIRHDAPGLGEVPVPEPVLARRIGGLTRVDTAVALSAEAFQTAPAAVVARADDYPDALVAAGLAADLQGPVLLTFGDHLDSRVAAELERLGVDEVVLAGGEDALSPAVEAELVARGYSVRRVAGSDRFGTAAAIADEIVSLGGPVAQAIVALGDHPNPERDAWADALAAGSLATTGRAPILLAHPDEVPQVSRDALTRVLEGDRVWIAGGTEAVSDTAEAQLTEDGHDVARLAGDDRYGTAVAVAEEAIAQGAGLTPTFLASGGDFPDALVAAPAAHARDGVLVLVHPSDLESSVATREWLAEHVADIREVLVAGGRDAVADAVLAQIDALLAG